MKLIGIGLGPGDPDLLTMKAVHYLGEIDVAIAAASEKSGRSYALDIARAHIRGDTEIVKAYFPMSVDAAERDAAYSRYADLIGDRTGRGKTVGFLCIGDPMLYSTFGRLSQIVRERLPALDIVTVPGIPAYCAAAAAANRVIALDDDVICIVPVNNLGRISEAARVCDHIVLLKVYRHRTDIMKRLEESGFTRDPLYVEKVGLPDQYMSDSVDDMVSKESTYLSLLFVDRAESPSPP
jgi:precorrin-2/cobalt-factor-2 C20-methyltransferase